jgi:hypothetical protein
MRRLIDGRGNEVRAQPGRNQGSTDMLVDPPHYRVNRRTGREHCGDTECEEFRDVVVWNHPPAEQSNVVGPAFVE